MLTVKIENSIIMYKKTKETGSLEKVDEKARSKIENYFVEGIKRVQKKRYIAKQVSLYKKEVLMKNLLPYIIKNLEIEHTKGKELEKYLKPLKKIILANKAAQYKAIFEKKLLLEIKEIIKEDKKEILKYMASQHKLVLSMINTAKINRNVPVNPKYMNEAINKMLFKSYIKSTKQKHKKILFGYYEDFEKYIKNYKIKFTLYNSKEI